MAHDKKKSITARADKQDMEECARENINQYLLDRFPTCPLIKTYIEISHEYNEFNIGKLELLHDDVPKLHATLSQNDSHITFATITKHAKLKHQSRATMMHAFIMYQHCILYYNSPDCMRDIQRVISLYNRLKQLHSNMILIDAYVDLSLTYCITSIMDYMLVLYEWCVLRRDMAHTPIIYKNITFDDDCKELYMRVKPRVLAYMLRAGV